MRKLNCQKITQNSRKNRDRKNRKWQIEIIPLKNEYKKCKITSKTEEKLAQTQTDPKKKPGVTDNGYD